MLAQATTRGVWQVSGGPANRSYADIFLRHAVALIGPGDAGPWRPGRDDSAFDGGFVRRFATEVQPGDIVLLRDWHFHNPCGWARGQQLPLPSPV
jgi:hypothetical protein